MDQNQAMVEARCRLVHTRDVMIEPVRTVIDELAEEILRARKRDFWDV